MSTHYVGALCWRSVSKKRCCVAGAFLVISTVNQEKYYNKKGQLSLALVICAESQDSSEASSVSWAISETRAFC